jgi:hypothetical protein
MHSQVAEPETVIVRDGPARAPRILCIVSMRANLARIDH